MNIVSWLAGRGTRRSVAGGWLVLCLAGPPEGAQGAAAGSEASPPGARQEAARELEGLLRDGRYRDAEAAARRSLAEIEKREGSESLAGAEVMRNLSRAMRLGGKFNDPQTRRFAERALGIKGRLLGQEDPSYATSLLTLADLLTERAEYGAARSLYERSLAIIQKALGPEHPKTADALQSLGDLELRVSNYRLAAKRLERAVEVIEKAAEPGEALLGRCLMRLGQVYYLLDRFDPSRREFERALAIQERVLRPEHPDLAMTQARFASLLKYLGEKERARELAQHALQVQERELGPAHPSLVVPLAVLAAVAFGSDDFAAARPLYEREIDIDEKALGPDHPTLASHLNDLGYFEFYLGEYAAARNAYERALAIQKRTLEPDDSDLAITLTNLGILLWHTGEWTQARETLERALAIDEKSYGPVHTNVAADRGLLALVATYMGDYSTARSLHERALAIREETLGPEHPLVGESLNNLALLLSEMGELAAARSLSERAVAIYEKNFPDGGPDLPTVLHTLGCIRRDQGDWQEAGRIFERATKMAERVLQAENAVTAEILNDEGALLTRMGERVEGRRALERALAVRGRTHGERHPMYAMTLKNLARLDFLEGRSESALERALKAEELVREQFITLARSLSEREALRYEEIRVSGLDLALSVLAGPAASVPAGAPARVLDEVVRSRALVLDEMGARRRSLEGEEAQAAAPAAALEAARSRLARLVVSGPGGSGPERYVDDLRKAQEEKDRAERVLAERSRSFRARRSRRQAGLADVRRSLPADTALVAYVQYRRPARTEAASAAAAVDERRYLALVLRPGGEAPTVVDLGGADAIDRLVQAWRGEAGAAPALLAASAAGSEMKSRQAGERLRAAVWDPLSGGLSGKPRVFVVPDGALNLVNFAALPAGADRYLLEEGPLLHLLSAERDLVRDQGGQRLGSGLMVVGGADYDAVPAAPAPAGIRGGAGVAVIPAASVLGRTSLYRGEDSPCAGPGAMKFQALSGSRQEADQVGLLWEQNAGRFGQKRSNVIRLVGVQANESLFKRSAAGRRVLHLATHGYFSRGECDPADRSGAAATEKDESGIWSENPLLLSGLALAGANRRDAAVEAKASRDIRSTTAAGTRPASATPQGEDGILTAEEIAGLDLSGVEWAVLSACETGVGKVQAGEGVLGLRRAFEVAGAGTLIMSLWPVEDAATREWMRNLYEGRLSGQSTAEAVRGASLKVLAARRRAGLSTHPFYWGAFVAAGDWR